MSIDYYVVELNTDFSDDEAISAKVAESFSIDPRKAKLLLSRAPGTITKPIVKAEAELIAARFRTAGLKINLKKLSPNEHSELDKPKKISDNISLPKRQLLTSTVVQETSTLSKNKSSLKLRMLISSLLAFLAVIALSLFLFLINSGKSEIDEIQNWQNYLPLFLASIFALVVALPILYSSYNNYRNAI